MAEGDCAAVDVSPVGIEAKLAHDRDRLAGEGLVELDQVEVVDAQLGAIERLARRRDGTEAHDGRIDAGYGRRDDARERLETVLARVLGLDEQPSRSRRR